MRNSVRIGLWIIEFESVDAEKRGVRDRKKSVFCRERNCSLDIDEIEGLVSSR